MAGPQLLASVGVSLDAKREILLNKNWLCHSLNHSNPSKAVPIILIEHGPKNMAEVKKSVKNFNTCIVFFAKKNALLLKTADQSHITTLESDSEIERVISILKSNNVADAKDEFSLMLAIKKVIDAIPNSTGDFDNRGLFATNYLRSRIFEDSRADIEAQVAKIKPQIGKNPKDVLTLLGWDVSNHNTYHDRVSLTITDQEDFSIRKSDTEVAPSYTAVATLRRSEWAILTNGKKWRLYTNRISASSTNYFEITLDPMRDSITQYLVVIFGFKSFEEIDGSMDINTFFEEGKNFAAKLEDDLSSKIMSADGLFLDIVKGVLDHDCKKIFTSDDLENAKHASLKTMYRIWFLAYAESRNLLPIRDEKYMPISLQSLRSRLDSYQKEPDGDKCWNDLQILFGGIRNGSPKHNLPQYAGDLFKVIPAIDNITVKNKFIVKALYGLLEKDDEAIDYASLSVRHLGNIFETLMEFSIRQAEKDLMLLEDKKGIREVATKQESTYSYVKNDLYLASKGGIALRKTSASFYTPDTIVKFLVQRGIEPIFAEREKWIKKDLQRYKKSKSDNDLQTCMDRLLDIQVLDPSMGSGHFLVEALNRITSWATDILKRHPEHPLLSEIESDRNTVLSEQKKKGVTIDKNLLTHDVLLKRKIMKRCIFGVDLNPLAVELAKLSLWLDSFAIGVPLTHMDHHIKTGDSTIGMFLDDLKNKEMHTLDDWTPSAESNKMISDVICSSDITVEQVHASEDTYNKHKKSLEPTRQILDALTASKIEPGILPKKAKGEFIHRFGRHSKNESNDLLKTRKIVNGLAQRHRFFHWELEMMDAFTDSRRGFDLVIGNPPWDKVKANSDEFFTPYEPMFRTLKPNTKKYKQKEKLLKNPEIKKSYDMYKKQFDEKGRFYSTYEMQETGDKDLWKLILERILYIVAENGRVSIVIPSQILSSAGTSAIRKKILEKNILSLYVFENKKKIFSIHSSYRFALLSVQNSIGPDKFSVGFYLHRMESLYDQSKEKSKFGTLSKKRIVSASPNECIMPEITGGNHEIFAKMSQNDNLSTGLGDGWEIKITSGFHKTNDADLLSKNSKNWPVVEGKNIHQYNHRWSAPEFMTNKRDGLKRERTKRVFDGIHVGVYDSFRLVFRDISSTTNARTAISTIIPPQMFHTNSLRSIVLTHNNKISLDANYDKKISYLCGLLNSLTFDFLARAVTQTHLSTVTNSISIPKPIHEDRISLLAAKLVVGTPEFEGFAESFRIKNTPLTTAQRIETTAEIDALVAYSYDLTVDQYRTVIESFNLFKKNPALYDLDEVTWDNKNLKEFYGEMADLAIQYLEAVTEAENGTP